MTSLMSMEDLFYGPPESTWILPTRDDRSYYRERDFSPPRRYYQPEPLRPVERLRPVLPHNDIRPVPLERLARVHTVAEPVRAHEEIRQVVQEPVVKSAVPVPTQVVTEPPLVKSAVPVPTQVVTSEPPLVKSAVPVPTQVVTSEPPLVKSAVPVPTQVVTAAPPVVKSAVPVPTQVVTAAPPVSAPAPAPPVQKRSVSPPRAIVHHPIELKVPMCCEKCARKVKERLLTLEGVTSVITDQYNQKVTVHGNVDPSRVLDRVKRVKKRSVFWDMTVDYSEKYRRARQAEDAALAREKSKAAVVKEEAAKSVVTPAPPKVVVNLPQEHRGPAVQAVLPEMNPMRVQQARYDSPAAGFRQEFVHAPREEMMRHPEFHSRRHGEVF